MVINILVYYKIIKNIFGTNEQDDYQVLSEKLQNFLICIEMVIAALAHHYSYPYQEHQINIPNYRAATAGNFRDMLRSMLDTDDIRQDMREHLGAVKNSLLKPFRGADQLHESKLLLAHSSAGNGGKYSNSASSSSRFDERDREPIAGPSSRYGTVNYVSTQSMIPRVSAQGSSNQQHHQGAPPIRGNMFRSGGSNSSRLDDSPTTTTTASSNTQTVKKSDSSNTDSWPTNSISDDVINIEVKGLEQNLIQLPGTPPL